MKELGSCVISDIVYENKVTTGEKEIYWRLVRPHVATDYRPFAC